MHNMAQYRVFTLVLSGRVDVFPIDYYVEPNFIRRVGGIVQNLFSKTLSCGRDMLSHVPHRRMMETSIFLLGNLSEDRWNFLL